MRGPLPEPTLYWAPSSKRCLLAKNRIGKSGTNFRHTAECFFNFAGVLEPGFAESVREMLHIVGYGGEL